MQKLGVETLYELYQYGALLETRAVAAPWPPSMAACGTPLRLRAGG